MAKKPQPEITKPRNVDGSNTPRSGGGLRKNRDLRKEQRRQDASLRMLERSRRNDLEQLNRLQQAGHGHCQEAIWLADLVAQA